MPIFSARDLREKFLKYFQSKDHKIIPSASLIPDNDPTVLFTTAGMHPLVPYLMGEKHPQGSRLVSVQKCVRTSDIDEVGDNTHHTFFEMLGNWSLGDYGKKEALEWTYEFLTSKKYLAILQEKLWVTVFKGNEVVPKDTESIEIWKSLGFKQERIIALSEKDNWWALGENGLCGPDTEVFIDLTGQACSDHCAPGLCECGRFVEIWNNVFMFYNKQGGQIQELKQKNIDTGMGFERTLAVLNGLDDNYRTELFWPLIQEIEKLSGKKYEDDKRSFRIIVDHIRTAVFILGDYKAVTPSNKDQGYILRRLIRRAVRHAKEIGINDHFMPALGKIIAGYYGLIYKELEINSNFIVQELEKEETKFKKTLESGLKELRKIFELKRTLGELQKNPIDGKICFDLFQTYGFPIEMIFEELENFSITYKYNLKIDKEKIYKDFEIEFEKHQDLSRTASAGMFKGGLADDKENTKKHHTAAHLLLQALRQVLQADIAQRGSNINEERVRFDFSYADKLTPEQIKQVEDLVNEQIQKKLPVTCQEMTLAEAKKYGALGSFEEKYGDKVKVYTVDGFSKEICGGPHVSNTGELGEFKIIKEESSSAGVRRIKAVLK
jgi:alanyl-tRNA synthetase